MATTWIDLRSGAYDPNDEDFVFVGFPSAWHNPYRSSKRGRHGVQPLGMSWEERVRAFAVYLRGRRDLLRRIPELKGKILVCYCGTAHPCHARVLAYLADLGVFEDFDSLSEEDLDAIFWPVVT